MTHPDDIEDVIIDLKLFYGQYKVVLEESNAGYSVLEAIQDLKRYHDFAQKQHDEEYEKPPREREYD